MASTQKLVSDAATVRPTVADLARRARAASRVMVRLSNELRSEVLLAIAKAIEGNGRRILEANERDLRATEPAVAAGKMSASMFARLRVKETGISEMAARVRDVARLPDPLGRRLTATELDEGLVLYKESCPLGVAGIVFEARPEVVPQVASIALKTANAVLLKGGAEATHSNEALVAIWKEALAAYPSVPLDSIHLLQSRADVTELLTLANDVDIIIPRGSREFVEFVTEHSHIPVLGHGEGICHVYVDRAADIEKALAVTLDSKTQYPAVCNAAETLLVHQDIAAAFLPRAFAMLRKAGVEIRGDARTMALPGNSDLLAATEQDWSTEYGDLILSVKVVDDVDAAIAHINHYGSRHTESIVTEDPETAKTFMNEVDAAGVFQNASTRFSDGYRYGLGAELGISNSKLHARGPMGIEGLTTYKYKLFGQGHIVAEYSKGLRHFKHRPLT